MDQEFDELYARAKKMHQQGKHAQAIRLFKQVLQLHPDDGMVMYNLANVLADSNQPREAIPLYKAALQQANKPAAWYNLANCYLDLGELDAAVDAYDQVLQLKPNHLQARFNQALAWQHKDMIDQAISCYQEVLRRDASFAPCHYNLACLLQGRNQEEAIHHLRMAIELDPQLLQMAATDPEVSTIFPLTETS